jgi:hypothetical protein
VTTGWQGRGNARFADGITGLVAALTALAEQGITMRYDAIRLRVAGGRCAEHWDVMVPRQ